MRIGLLILMLTVSFQLQAQFNISVGYGMGYTPAKVHNEVIHDFNSLFRDSIYFGDEMRDLHVLHGLSLGFRWKYEQIAVEFNWENLGRTREAFGEDEFDVLFNKTIFYTMNNYSINFESSRGVLGLGFGGGYRRVKIKEQIANTDRKLDIISSPQYFLKTYLSINLRGGNNVGLSIKPYVSFPFKSVNLKKLAEELTTPENTLSIPTSEEKFLMGGLTFIFYNGYQD